MPIQNVIHLKYITVYFSLLSFDIEKGYSARQDSAFFQSNYIPPYSSL